MHDNKSLQETLHMNTLYNNIFKAKTLKEKVHEYRATCANKVQSKSWKIIWVIFEQGCFTFRQTDGEFRGFVDVDERIRDLVIVNKEIDQARVRQYWRHFFTHQVKRFTNGKLKAKIENRFEFFNLLYQRISTGIPWLNFINVLRAAFVLVGICQ